MSAQPVTETTARRLLVLLAKEQVAARAPSLVAGVLREGELVWSGSRGSVVSADPGVSPTTDTQYRIGSITKILTALLVLQLRDEGALQLTDRLDRHLPGVAYGARTLRELLSHSSGMPAEPPGPWWERSAGVPFDDLVSRLDETAAVFRPGQEFHYSNVGFALLGEVVARVRGTSWATVLTSRVLEPLGMHRTTYLASEPAAAGFSVDAFSGELTPEPSHDSLGMAAAGQLWSTVEDLSRLAAFLLDPHSDVLAPESVSEMTVGQIGVPDEPAAGSYGLGLSLGVAGERSYLGHTGSVPGFRAGLFLDRVRSTAGICVSNGGTGLRAEAFPLDLMRVLEEQEPSIPPAWTPAASLPPAVRDVLGLWHWGNQAFTMSYEDEVVVARILDSGLTWCTFRRVDARGVIGATGYFAGEPLTAVRRPDGSVGHLECATFIFTRVPYDPQAPIPGG